MLAQAITMPYLKEMQSAFAEALKVPVTAIDAIARKPNSDVADSPCVMMIRGTAVLILSPPEFPDVIADRESKAREMKEYLGVRLGEPIISVLLEGRIDGRSFAILPWRNPISERKITSWVQRRKMVQPLASWLTEIMAIHPVKDARSAMESSLSDMKELLSAPPAMREVAAKGLQRVSLGKLQPRHAPMHGDLWRGNVLAANRGSARPFTLIDFGASRVAGFPFYDLIRVAQSFPMRPSELRYSVLDHCRHVGCEAADAPVFVTAALGLILQNLEEFPLSSFIDLTERCSHTMVESGMLRVDWK